MSPTDPNVGEKLAALRREYSARLPSRIALIEDIWQKLNRHGCNAIMSSTLVNLVHQLSGSGRTFGYAALSEHASALEARISPLKEQTAMPSDAERTTIDAMIAKLKESAQKPDTTEPARVNAAAPRKENFRPGKLIYVIDDDTALAEYLATQLRERGFQTRTFDAPNLFHEELAHENPAAILMDIGFPEGDLAGIDAVAQLRAATGARTPVIFVSGRSDMSSRLAAIRAGGDAYLTKPVDLYTLGMTLEELTTQTAVEKLRVLIIDDDKTLAEHYAAVLNQTGMTARVLLNPMHALQHIKEFHPNLVLMDFHLPQCNGIELSKVLRQEQALADLPIVFISVDPHPDIQRRIFGMGETDFLQKPVKDDVLTATVLKCIKRSRWISNRVNDVVREDPATGLLNRRHLLADLEMAVAGATAGNNYPAVLFVAIDNLDVIRKSTGVSGIEYTLRQVQSALRNCLTSADSLCHYSEGVYVALTARRTPEAATALVARVRATLEQLSIKTERDGTRLAVSVGFHLITPESRNARHALGEAERLTGGSAITVPDTPKVATTAPGDISVETVRHALEAQSFRLVYQPIVNLGDLGQELFEARVRLVSNDGTTLLPSQFLPVCLKLDREFALDRWVIENVIEAHANNPRARIHASLFIKLSAQSLGNRKLITFLGNTLRNSKIKGQKRLFFEIDEADALAQTQEVSELAQAIKVLDCDILIDHCSTSRNSLQLVERLRPTFVKILGDPLKRLLVDRQQQTRLHSFVMALQEKGVAVIIGEVENRQMLQLLQEWGVKHFQGHYIQKPVETLTRQVNSSKF